jgi:hypothetical protein
MGRESTMTERKGKATEKKESREKRRYHCACAPGDLSAIQPMVAPPADDTAAKPGGGKPSKPQAALAPGAVEKPKARG